MVAAAMRMVCHGILRAVLKVARGRRPRDLEALLVRLEPVPALLARCHRPWTKTSSCAWQRPAAAAREEVDDEREEGRAIPGWCVGRGKEPPEALLGERRQSHQPLVGL